MVTVCMADDNLLKNVTDRHAFSVGAHVGFRNHPAIIYVCKFKMKVFDLISEAPFGFRPQSFGGGLNILLCVNRADDGDAANTAVG